MSLRYEEWLPLAGGLKGNVTAYWHVAGDGTQHPSPAVLPDGHIEIVLNLGDPVGLAGPVFVGDQPDRAVVGLLSKAFRLEYRGQVNTFGIRFHPARGAGFLGLAATDLIDKLIPLAEVCLILDEAIREVIAAHTTLETEDARTELDQVLLRQLCSALPSDAEIVAMVDRLTGSESAPLVSEMALELGLSPRQLQRRFRAAVGVSPKHFVRMQRFARVWQAAAMHPDQGWAELASEYGYADQAHLVREFRAFGAEPPTRVFTSEWYGATEISRVSGPVEGVRSVQDSPGKPRI